MTTTYLQTISIILCGTIVNRMSLKPSEVIRIKRNRVTAGSVKL